MAAIDEAVIDHFGGTSATAKLMKAPISTVHSWRSIGIPESRLDHLRLIGKEIDRPLPDDLTQLLELKAALEPQPETPEQPDDDAGAAQAEAA